MKIIVLVTAFVFGLIGCSTLRPVKNPNSGPLKGNLSSPSFRIGDFVVYQYSGKFSSKPVTLKETVISRSQNQLTFFVEWRSGDELRQWKQVVTETPENLKDNVVDQLIEIVGHKEILLENKANVDLWRLFTGTYILPEGHPELVSRIMKNFRLGREQLKAEGETGFQQVAGRKMRFENFYSESFVWNLIESTYWDGDQIFYQAKVVDTNFRL